MLFLTIYNLTAQQLTTDPDYKEGTNILYKYDRRGEVAKRNAVELLEIPY